MPKLNFFTVCASKLLVYVIINICRKLFTNEKKIINNIVLVNLHVHFVM
jgi:hypothetical protein